MSGDKKLVVLSGIGYLLGLYLVFFLYSPTIAVNAIKQAMHEKNADLLSNYVDFNAIQKSILFQINAELILKSSAQRESVQESDPVLLARVSNVTKAVEGFIGSFLSRNGLARLFEMSDSVLVDPQYLSTKNYISSLQDEQFILNNDFEYKSLGEIQVKGLSKNGREHYFILTFRLSRWVLTDYIYDLNGVSSDEIVRFIDVFNSILSGK